jgi:hypothetical protein
VSSRSLDVVNVAFLFGVRSDNADDADLPHLVSDSESAEEVETEYEELWRRKRHEREMFLQQHKVCTDFTDRQEISPSVQ